MNDEINICKNMNILNEKRLSKSPMKYNVERIDTDFNLNINTYNPNSKSNFDNNIPNLNIRDISNIPS